MDDIVQCMATPNASAAHTRHSTVELLEDERGADTDDDDDDVLLDLQAEYGHGSRGTPMGPAHEVAVDDIPNGHDTLRADRMTKRDDMDPLSDDFVLDEIDDIEMVTMR